MAKKPAFIEDAPVSLITLDPAAAARSIADVVAMASGEKDFLDEVVTIQFYNLEQPGKSDQVFIKGGVRNPDRLTLNHGEIRDLPRSWIRFIESRQEPIYQYSEEGGNATTGQKRKRVKNLVGWKPRFQCREVRRAIKKSA